MKKKVILDILFYLAVPLLFWNFLRDYLGSYYTLLAATVPGTIYAVTTFIREKEHRITGYVLFGGMIVARLMDLIVSSPEGVLWNDVRVNIGFVILWTISLLVKKPIGLYFFLDYASYSGLNYSKAKKHYIQRPFVKYFYYFTLLLLVQDMIMAGVYTILIKSLGIDGYNKIQIITSTIGYVNIGLIIAFVYYIVRMIKKEEIHERIRSDESIVS